MLALGALLNKQTASATFYFDFSSYPSIHTAHTAITHVACNGRSFTRVLLALE